MSICDGIVEKNHLLASIAAKGMQQHGIYDIISGEHHTT
jgi:hypothetical protein